VFGYQIFHPVDAQVFVSCANDGLGEFVHQTTFGEAVAAIIVERGRGEIGSFRYLFHVTVNANGDAVSTVDHYEATC
jgi:hypothetical protein